MTARRFVHWRNPDRVAVERLQAIDRYNALSTYQYAEARQRLGEEPWLFTLDEGAGPVAGCLGFRSGRGRSLLEIPSVPDLSSTDPFWDELWSLSVQTGVRSLELGSFGSEATDLPMWSGRLQRRSRTEWVVDLGDDGPRGKVDPEHRRRARKAAAAGLECRIGSDPEWIEAHLRCIGSSMDRRNARGEQVPDPLDGASQRAFLATGAGELAQALHGGLVVSSVLFLRSSIAAYSQTAGTSEQGRSLNASKFLHIALIEALQKRGMVRFNLGGAQADNPGLQAFKRGFGARPVELESASFSTSSPSLRKLKTLGRRARDLLTIRR